MIEVKDRIPTYPGRVKLIPVSGQANTYDLVRADQPIEAGTPINRALFQSLLDDINAIRQQVDDKLFEMSKKVPLKAVTNGETFGLYENGVLVPFIKLWDVYGNSQRVVAVRKNIVKLDTFSPADGLYENSNVDQWLSNEYVNYFGPDVQAVMEAVRIYCFVQNGTSSILRKVFLLSPYEMGDPITQIGDRSYPFFYSDERRVATYNGVPYAQWTREKWNKTSADVIAFSATGTRINGNSASDKFGIRPALTLHPDLEVVVGVPDTENVMATAEV